ncbi:hypothetical protein N7466_010019 [Penicillium verhagenii]|uniref:uncharacterized protein n=1 Tax=Penicillium verhagenii TaxID=1562060 RepID=UPI00254510AE|nr:uncharacterized protein N7466_010019 [Penicillium verhagenii]KAJ5919076.1 hypothetical protein N7466_010019 [Penicillium verhagenii]
MQPSEIASADEDWLIDLCHGCQNEGGMIGGEKHGYKVIKISDQVVVKYGYVQESEAATQEAAFNAVDQNIVQIPEVYRYIESNRSSQPVGYLFMEHIHGRTLDKVDLNVHTDIPSRVVKILEHLGQIRSADSIPGPVKGGEAMGYIFGDEGAKTAFTSLEHLTAYMNKRLQYRNDSIDLEPYDQNLVLCHGDICRRNIIMKEDGALTLLDWGYSGFYPRFFELATLSCVLPYDKEFQPLVKREFEEVLNLTDQEKQDMKFTLCVRGANLRWSFDEPAQSYEETCDKIYRDALASNAMLAKKLELEEPKVSDPAIETKV